MFPHPQFHQLPQREPPPQQLPDQQPPGQPDIAAEQYSARDRAHSLDVEEMQQLRQSQLASNSSLSCGRLEGGDNIATPSPPLVAAYAAAAAAAAPVSCAGAPALPVDRPPSGNDGAASVSAAPLAGIGSVVVVSSVAEAPGSPPEPREAPSSSSTSTLGGVSKLVLAATPPFHPHPHPHPSADARPAMATTPGFGFAGVGGSGGGGAPSVSASFSDIAPGGDPPSGGAAPSSAGRCDSAASDALSLDMSQAIMLGLLSPQRLVLTTAQAQTGGGEIERPAPVTVTAAVGSDAGVLNREKSGDGASFEAVGGGGANGSGKDVSDTGVASRVPPACQ